MDGNHHLQMAYTLICTLVGLKLYSCTSSTQTSVFLGVSRLVPQWKINPPSQGRKGPAVTAELDAECCSGFADASTEHFKFVLCTVT